MRSYQRERDESWVWKRRKKLFIGYTVANKQGYIKETLRWNYQDLDKVDRECFVFCYITW